MPKRQKRQPPVPQQEPERTGGLCHRCEHRVLNLEDKYLKRPHARQPRCECGDGGSKHSCYMYSPVMPVVLSRDDGDRRPMFMGSLFSARSHIVRLPVDEMYQMVVSPDGRGGDAIKYWKPRYIHWVRKKKEAEYVVCKKEKCPRCGRVHRNLIYRKLVKPANHPGLSYPMDYWATCPYTGEPILASHELMESRGELE